MKGKLGIGFDTFQFTPLREGRLYFIAAEVATVHFNSRPSARGDGRADAYHRAGKAYFNSRPSARGDCV